MIPDVCGCVMNRLEGRCCVWEQWNIRNMSRKQAASVSGSLETGMKWIKNSD